jgi:hypothetical protein
VRPWSKAKPPPVNWLGYRAPPWVSSIEYLPGSDNKMVLLGTGEHQLRLYDVRVDKRAVLDMSVGRAARSVPFPPKPYTLNSIPYTQNSKPKTLNLWTSARCSTCLSAWSVARSVPSVSTWRMTVCS